MWRLVLADVRHQARRQAVSCDQVGVGKQLLRPGEQVERANLDEKDSGHRPDEGLESGIYRLDQTLF